LTLLESLQENIVTEINAKLKGKTIEILVEGKQKASGAAVQARINWYFSVIM